MKQVKQLQEFEKIRYFSRYTCKLYFGRTYKIFAFFTRKLQDNAEKLQELTPCGSGKKYKQCCGK